MRREVATSHISLCWTVYQHLIKLCQSFKVPLNYTQRKCGTCRMPVQASEFRSCELEASLKKYIVAISPHLEASLEYLKFRCICQPSITHKNTPECPKVAYFTEWHPT